MARFYVGVRAVGRATAVFERVRQAVERLGLANIIPVVKFERNPRRQFYLFLATENSDGRTIPDQVTEVLRFSGLTGAFGPLSLDQIRPMVSRTELEIHGFNSLAYRSLWSTELGDPFDLSEGPRSEYSGDPEATLKFNKLIYWLSAMAEGTWETFARACTSLKLVDDAKYARRLFRRFILLGHIESSADGLRWSICPTTLIRSPTEESAGFLCGQRTPRILDLIRAKYEVREINQPRHEGPTCLQVCIPQAVELQGGTTDGICIEPAGVASVSLKNILPDIDGWKDQLTPIGNLNFSNYEIEKWSDGSYHPYESFVRGGYIAESGMYRLTRKEGKSDYHLVLYFDIERNSWLKADWYGLRFLADHLNGTQQIVVQNSEKNDLFIPLNGRWPMIYERALVLTNGLLPQRGENPNWLKYTGIPVSLASDMTLKLGLQLQERQHV